MRLAHLRLSAARKAPLCLIEARAKWLGRLDREEVGGQELGGVVADELLAKYCGCVEGRAATGSTSSGLR